MTVGIEHTIVVGRTQQNTINYDEFCSESPPFYIKKKKNSMKSNNC